MTNIVLFGPPGAGKGTQSQNIIDQFQLVHLSTGDLLRGEIKEGTALGLEAKKLMDAGTLVPDEVVIGMIGNKIDQSPEAKGYIFDGFPRTVPQAEALDSLLESKGSAVHACIALEVEEEELVSRLLKRGEVSGRTDDQNEELIRKRVVEYNTKTAPVATFYSGQGKYHGINGIGKIEIISSQIAGIIEGLA